MLSDEYNTLVLYCESVVRIPASLKTSRRKSRSLRVLSIDLTALFSRMNIELISGTLSHSS